jgi:hypothetical protein
MGESNFYLRSFGKYADEVDLESLDPREPMGLAKRLALKLDLDQTIDDIEGVTFFQEGKTIVVRDDNLSLDEKIILEEHIYLMIQDEQYVLIQSIGTFCKQNPEHPQCI